MLEASLRFIKDVNSKFDLKPRRVIDIGSKDRNLKIGARDMFPNSEYIGVDMEQGSNVDMIADAYHLDKQFSRGRFDAVLCLHLFEHVAKPWLVFRQVDYLLPDDGLFYVSVPTIGYPIHNYPGDYWRALEHAASTFSRHPFINCVGRKNAH
jgi:predicted SAM-dependent methyltransferase